MCVPFPLFVLRAFALQLRAGMAACFDVSNNILYTHSQNACTVMIWRGAAQSSLLFPPGSLSPLPAASDPTRAQHQPIKKRCVCIWASVSLCLTCVCVCVYVCVCVCVVVCCRRVADIALAGPAPDESDASTDAVGVRSSSHCVCASHRSTDACVLCRAFRLRRSLSSSASRRRRSLHSRARCCLLHWRP